MGGRIGLEMSAGSLRQSVYVNVCVSYSHSSIMINKSTSSLLPSTPLPAPVTHTLPLFIYPSTTLPVVMKQQQVLAGNCAGQSFIYIHSAIVGHHSKTPFTSKRQNNIHPSPSLPLPVYCIHQSHPYVQTIIHNLRTINCQLICKNHDVISYIVTRECSAVHFNTKTSKAKLAAVVIAEVTQRLHNRTKCVYDAKMYTLAVYLFKFQDTSLLLATIIPTKSKKLSFFFQKGRIVIQKKKGDGKKKAKNKVRQPAKKERATYSIFLLVFLFHLMCVSGGS